MVALARQLGRKWPRRDGQSLAYAVRYLVPVVQVPPRGIWGAGGQATWTTVEAWLGRSLAADTEPDAMILRYLAAFGPASVRDIQAWCWLTRLNVVMERLRPSMRMFRAEDGTELFDLLDAPRPDPQTPAPPRFLPEYDNLLLSHSDRSRVISDGYLERVFTRGSFLLDGRVRGAWKIARKRDASTLAIEAFERLSKPEGTALQEEAERLLAFAAEDSKRREIQLIEKRRAAGAR